MKNYSKPLGRNITKTELAELRSRWFWGDEDWIKMKQKLDTCLAYRKSIKGKPTEEQMMEINNNAMDIDFYNKILFFYR